MPNIERRDFLKLVGAGSVGVGAGFYLRESIKHPMEHLIPHVVAPEDFSTGIDTWYNTVCSMCAAGCGISVRTREGRVKKIEGNPSHPVSQGRLCALGQAGPQVLYNPDRLTGPLMQTGERGSGAFAQITWDEGLSKVADRLDLLRAAERGNRVCLLSQGVRGHLAQLFERFVDQLGSERLLHYDFDHPHTLYAANQRFFGEQRLPYYDLKNTRYLLSFGADYLGSWISPVHHSLGFGHSRQGRPDVRGRFVQIEPRMSLSGAAADEWIAARPGTEGLLALAVAHHILSKGYYQGADRADWIAVLAGYTTTEVAAQTGVPAETIVRLADAFAQTQPSLAIGGGSAGNHSNGVDTLVAVNALNYLVGNLGKAGGLVFNPEPAGPTTHPHQASYRTMLEFVEDARRGNIEVLIVNGTNPVFTLPSAAGFAEALAEIPLIVSLSSFLDETTALADVILPSHTYLESWGDDFPEPGVGFPVGAVSQPVASPLYDTRATGDIILGLAQRLDMNDVLPWSSMEDCIKDGWRQIHERGGGDVRTESFESFWRAVLTAGVWGEETHRESTFTLDKSVIAGIGVQAPEFSGASDDYPFILHPYLSTTLHDGRAANLPWLQELPDPMTSVVYGSWVEMNPVTAKGLGLTEGDLVDIESPHGRIRAPVYVYPAIMPDVIAMPIGQGHAEYGRYARNRGVNPIEILSPQMEPQTGSLASSATRVKITATGRRAELVKTGGNSRDLGRNIVQTTGAGQHSANLNSIPITVIPS
ncbi:MAG: twin-arginine translocation signal domain-containing protein [Gammaproteobacteria bacterium]|nr:MAG: twin-arginine translocation signal domain-containing protein [Gammaproteobacteria bacterium]